MYEMCTLSAAPPRAGLGCVGIGCATPVVMTRLAISIISSLFLFACGGGVGNDGTLVGGPCATDRDCAELCARGGDFPGGTCTVPCLDDRDCPSDTACIDKEGGICLLLCHFDTDCRPGYECEDESRRGASGKATVCIDD
jgi:hypothetical protein